MPYGPAAILPLLCLLQAQGAKSVDELLVEKVAKHCPQADASLREVYVERLRQAGAPYWGTPLQKSVLDRMDHWISYPSFRLEGLDFYRRASVTRPELLSRALPAATYVRAYEHGLRLSETELREARPTPPSAETVSQIERQLEALRGAVTPLLRQKVTGAHAEAAVDSLVDARVRSLRRVIGDPFAGIHRSLTEEELAGVLREFRVRTDALSPIRLDRPELADPAEAFRQASRKAPPPDPDSGATLERAHEIRSAISECLDPFVRVSEANHPRVTEELRLLRMLIDEAEASLRSVEKVQEDAYLKALTREGVRDMEGRLPTAAAGPVPPPGTKHPDAGNPQSSPEQGRDVPLGAVGRPLLVLAVVLAAVGVAWLSRRRKAAA